MLWTRFRDPFDDDGSPLGISRDDLIRLVVGMQWQTAMAQHGIGWAFTAWEISGWTPQNGAFDLRPAVDIVDEWLGVR